jgi:hypothetical protein
MKPEGPSAIISQPTERLQPREVYNLRSFLTHAPVTHLNVLWMSLCLVLKYGRSHQVKNTDWGSSRIRSWGIYTGSKRKVGAGDRISVGRYFPHPSRPVLRPNQPPTQWVYPRDKAAEVWRLPPTPSSAEVKERVELYLHSPSGPRWPVLRWHLPLQRER